MTAASMYARFAASDASYDGRFFTGVVTTGIYCIPSCRARKPKASNVRFFPTIEAAREAGFRPCRKCYPDDFARGADPVLESIEALAAEVRANPATFPDARSIVHRSGYGTTRAFELFRRYFHQTPADLLLRARVQKAREFLLQGADSVSDAAFSVGFESLSAFHENFRLLTGLTPAAYRELPAARTFDIALPDGYSLPHLRHALSRDVESVTERMDGDSCMTAIQLEDAPALLRLDLAPQAVTVTCPPGTAVAAHRIAVRLLGLGQDAAGFRRLAIRLGFQTLPDAGGDLRISQTPTIFDGLLWAIVGQQITFSFACRLRRRLVELCGTPVGQNLIAPPSPKDVARLDPETLLPLQFSRSKAEHVIGTARLVVEGRLDLDALACGSAARAERTLLAVRGLGPWSANYLMMRSLGFADCVPLGDTGVTSGLQRLMHLDIRPDLDATRRLMGVFSPYRSLATAHLWQLNRLNKCP
jgi:AraC family transcriptional regulator of adaptative response / DNA-3-methyladenine glycosylase II